jgi:tRNA-Thr(GGU) m(6)t(6)A37 methyltransferase TsaA
METYTMRPIGILRTPHAEPKGTPIQPSGAGDTPGVAEVFPEFAPGLKDLDGFSHVILLYVFHLAGPPKLLVTPFLDEGQHGVFSTRAPSRPNPLGLSVVRLERVEGNRVFLRGADMVDGTPLLDIKPHVGAFNAGGPERLGWLEKRLGQAGAARDDGRFAATESGEEKRGGGKE